MIEHRDVESAPPPETESRGNGNGHHAPEDRQLPEAPEVKALPPAPETAPRRRRGRGLLWLILFAALGYAGWRYYTGVQQKEAAAEAARARQMANRPVTVTAAPARRGDMPIYLRGLGTATAYNTVNIKTRVDGPIVAVNFKEGQQVKKGDLLVEVDPRPLQVALQQAEGALARDQSQLNDAQVNLARYQKLWDEGVIARQQLDTQAAQVGQFKGTIEADQAAIANARLNLSFARVTAPISGRIGLRQVDIGNIVHASDANPMAVITQIQPIAVLFTIPADNLPPVLAKLRSGARLPVDAYDRGDVNKIATGVLETVDNQIDPSTGTSRLKAVFQNTEGVLFPNQFVNCRMLLETRRGVVLVPTAAIQRGPQGPYVYVAAANGTAMMRPVTLGTAEGAETEVTSGIAPGDMVITDGQDKLREGSHVDVRNAPPGSGGAGRGRRGQGAAPASGVIPPDMAPGRNNPNFAPPQPDAAESGGASPSQQPSNAGQPARVPGGTAGGAPNAGRGGSRQ